MSLTRRSLIAGALAAPVAACKRQAFSEVDPRVDRLDQYRVKGWQVMWNGYDPERFRKLYRIVDANADD